MKLTDKKINHQDFVDNTTFNFINSLIPNTQQIDRDIDGIGKLHKFTCNVLSKQRVCFEKLIYPSI